MIDELQLNVSLLRRRVPNLTTAAKAAGLRPATVSNLCTGKIPVGRAEVRTLVTLAALANCSLDELIIRGGHAAMMETGIKVLDLFAPVVRGGTVGLVAAGPGTGQLVMLAELFRRMKKRGYASVFWKTEDAPGLEEVIAESDLVCGSVEQAYERVVEFQAERDVLLGADRTVVLSGELLELQQRLREAGTRLPTVLLVDTRFEAADEEVPYGPLDTMLRFDMDMAVRKLFPAVDPVYSTSALQEGAQLEAAHLAVQQRARKSLRRYRELRTVVRAHGIEKLPESDRLTYRRGERLEAFLSQPFYVAEPFTKKSGEWLPLQDTLDGVRRILDGAADGMETGELTYIGTFPRG